MNRFIQFLLTFFVLHFSSPVFLLAQKVIERSSPDKPSWAIEPPTGKYFIYYSGIGTSSTSLADAKKQAIANVLSEINMEENILITSELQTRISEKSEKINGELKTSLIDEAIQEVIAKGGPSIIENLTKDEEYWQKIKNLDGISYEYWLLMKIPKPEYDNLDLRMKQGYGKTPVWKSVIVPGWGQFHKGEPKKGRRFLISETVFVSTFFISNYYSHNYSRKAENERDYDRRKYYNDWSNRAFGIGTVSGIIAGAIHVYNIFDSITAKGAKKYAYKQPKPLEVFAGVNHNQFKIIISVNI